MTRVNCGVPVQELEREHLLAEHREITRIPNAIKSGRANVSNIPTEFKLGKGHVKFFYDKLGYLKGRYLFLYIECKRRGYKVTNKIDSFIGLPKHLMNNYTPTKRDKAIVRERITERLKKENERN